MKTFKKLTNFIFILTLASSCTYIYYPTYPVVPDADDKGFGIQGTAGFTKAQFSMWYAIDSNWYFTGTVAGALSLTGDGDSNTTRKFGSKSLLGGVGYKVPLSANAEFNIQAGGGSSFGFFRTTAFNPENTNLTDLNDLNTMSSRFYVQPSFKISRGKGGFYIIPRATYEMFNRVKSEEGSIEFKNRNFLIAEFFLMGRFNLKHLNLELYGGIAANLSSSGKFEDSWVAQPILMGISLSRTFKL